MNRFTLGAPGVYHVAPSAVRSLTGVRMDVAAFVGVAPRGPARASQRSIPVAVESWDEYRRLYGSFEGPGLMPYAVASFFEQGGTRAYIVRIVHDYQDAELDRGGVASAAVPGLLGDGGQPLRLTAADEGAWGHGITASMTFQARPLPFDHASLQEVVVDAGTPVSPGTLLRIVDAAGIRVLRFVSAVRTQPRLGEWGRERVLTLEFGLPAAPERVEVVTATVSVADLDRRIARNEVHEVVGLSPEHPRWLASVLRDESSLVRVAAPFAGLAVRPTDPSLATVAAEPFRGGTDRYVDIESGDFFDPTWHPSDDRAGDGVQSLAELDDLSLLVVPDLYSPRPLNPIEGVLDVGSLAGPTFESCVVAPAPPHHVGVVPDLPGLRLDPTLPSDLAVIADLQERLVRFAESLRSFVVLLDVPPGLGQRAILRWRARFESSYGAGYHPWLKVSEAADDRDGLVSVNPSSVAAGIVARREHVFGVPFGPANELAAGVVDVEERVAPARHDELHQSAVNVYVRERDGVRLSAARTLSRDPAYRQLNVRRLMTMLRRVLESQTQWVAFEPNGPELWADVRNFLTSFLRQLYVAGAFTGATEAEAFFVRCDGTLNSAPVLDTGRLIVEIGVAPAEPIEFIVLQLLRDGDGSVRVEEPSRGTRRG